MAEEILTKIGEREKELSALRTRMSEDLDRYLMKAHVTKGHSGRNKSAALPGIANVTTNRARVWGDHALSLLNTAYPAMVIDSKDLQDAQMATVRDWWYGLFYSANQRFEGHAELPIHEYSSFQAILRGLVSVRALCWRDEETGNIVWDIRPLDGPTVAWEKTADGLLWASVTTERSKSDILKEYGVEVADVKGKVVDYWGKDNSGAVIESIFIDEKKAKEVAHEHVKEVPFSISAVILAPLVIGSSEADIRMFAESIYAACRKDFDEINDAASLLKTQAIKDVKHPLIHTSMDPTKQQLTKYPADFGDVVELSAGQDLKDVPTRDNMGNVMAFAGMMDADMQRSTAPHTDYGNLQFELSALAIDKLTGQMTKVLLPRRKALEIMYKRVFELLKGQFIAGNFEATVTDKNGTEVKISSTDMKALNGKYQVRFQCNAVDPQSDTVKLQKAQSAMTVNAPQHFIDTVIMQYGDVDEVERRRTEDRVKSMMPELYLLDAYKDVKELELKATDPIEKTTLQMKAEMIEERINQLKQASKQQVPTGGM